MASALVDLTATSTARLAACRRSRATSSSRNSGYVKCASVMRLSGSGVTGRSLVPGTLPEESPDSRIGPHTEAMAVHELEVDHEDVENDRVVCPTCGRPLWLADEPSMTVKLRDIELATTNRVVSVVVTGTSPMIFATCTCGDSLQITIRRLMPLPGPQR